MTRSPARPTLLLLIVAALALPRAASALEPPAPPPAIVPDLAAAAAAGPASTAAYGARCIGPAHDDTPAFQAAIDTGHTVYAPAMGGHCHITHALVMRTPGQIFGGDGRARTRIEIQPGFTGEGVFVAKTGEPGPVWRDFAVSFSQPDTDKLAAILSYPPAFGARATPRFEIADVGCFEATICVDMQGNSGGATITDFEMSAFQTGIQIDGSFDTVRLSRVHAWPFLLTQKQSRLMHANVAWLRLSKVDDLKISDSLFLTGIGLSVDRSAQGTTTGSISGTVFDGARISIEMSAGNLSMAGGYMGSGGPDDQQVKLTGGTLAITAATLGCSSRGVATALPVFDVKGSATSLSISNSPSLVCGSDDRPIISVEDGSLIFSGNYLDIAPNTPYKHDKITLKGSLSRVVAIGNRVNDKGRGAGVLFRIAENNFNRVIGNSAPGWSYVLGRRAMPTTMIVPNPGVYFAN